MSIPSDIVEPIDNDDELTNEAEEKQFEDDLENIDAIEQIKADMSVPAGVAEMAQPTSVRHRRFHFLSRIPFVSRAALVKRITSCLIL